MNSSVSVLVVAHNEEKYIAKCLTSLSKQTKTPDEIVVLAHNCTDKTEEISRSFPNVRLVSYQGPAGTVYARMQGFKSVKGNIVACIDGDSFAKENWVEEITKPFADPNVTAAHTLVLITNTLMGPLATFKNFYVNEAYRFFNKNYRATNFWGPSFAIRLSEYEKAGGLDPLISLREKLQLSEWCEDYYIFLILRRIGKVVLTYKTMVTMVNKQQGLAMIIRSAKQGQDGWKLWNYFLNRK